MVDVKSLFMSPFLTPDPSQTEVLGKFVDIYFWADRFPPISAKRKRVRMNKKKRRKICAKGNDVTTSVICANQHFASTFSMQIFKFQRRTVPQGAEELFVMASEAKCYSRSYESPLITVESTMNLTYQTVIRSRYKPGKIWLNARWELASHAGVFRGARISSLPTNACSTENNIPFPLFYSRGKWPINRLK